MKRYLINVFILCVFVMLAACASHLQRESHPIDNPMPELWSTVSNEIQSLEETDSNKDKWSSAAESEEIVNTREQLDNILNKSRLPEEDKILVRQMFKSSQLIAHFGFEADYHALVVFSTTERPIRVFAW